MNKRHLDDTKPYSQEQIKRESFQWAKPLIKLLKQDKEAKYWQVEAHFPVSSMNRNVYSRDELLQAVHGLPGQHVDLDHFCGQIQDGKKMPDWTIDGVEPIAANYENDAVECILRVLHTATDAKGRNVNAAIESGEIDHVSIEADAPESYEENGEIQVRGLVYTGLALLDQDSLPGIPLTRLMPLESLRESIFAEVDEAAVVRGYEPPESGDLPEDGKTILGNAYASCRKNNPDYPKEKCSKIAWGAVHNAGYSQGADGKWVKEMENTTQKEENKITQQNEKPTEQTVEKSPEKLEVEADLQKQIADEKQANVDSQKEVDKLTEDLRKANDKANDALAEVAKLKKVKTQSEARITNVFEEIQQQKDERIDALEKANKALEDKVADFEAKNAGLLEKSNSYLKQLKDESEKRASADQRAVNEMKQTTIVKEENANLAQENADLTRKLSDNTQKIADLSRKLYAAEKELSDVKESYSDVSRKYRKIRRVVIKT